MNERSGTYPVRWWTFDSFASPVPHEVPDEHWRGWEAHYNGECERGKRTTRDIESVFPFTDAWRRLLTPECAAEWSARLGYAVEHDPTLHGGGVHVTRAGGSLATHLDYAKHPKVPDKRRALNLILFLHPEWTQEWGGEFYLADPMGKPVVTILPKPGRLLAFECGELAYHGHHKTGENAADRVSVAVYLLAAARECDTRTRALFMPVRGG